MKIVFLAYREWALKVIDKIKGSKNIHNFILLKSPEEFEKFSCLEDSKNKVIIAIGWSWILPKKFTEENLCLGIHPSDLPNFRGGSPLQNQIINGLVASKVTIFQLTSELDAGKIWGKEDLCLEGDSFSEIEINLVKSSVKLLRKFFDKFPNIKPEIQNISEGSYYKRRLPEDSKIDIKDFKKHGLKKIYDKIRCLTDPYPNAYIEDSKGNKLYFKQIEYQVKR